MCLPEINKDFSASTESRSVVLFNMASGFIYIAAPSYQANQDPDPSKSSTLVFSTIPVGQGPVKVDWNVFDKIPLNLPFAKEDFKYSPLKKGGEGGFWVEPPFKMDSTR